MAFSTRRFSIQPRGLVEDPQERLARQLLADLVRQPSGPLINPLSTYGDIGKSAAQALMAYKMFDKSGTQKATDAETMSKALAALQPQTLATPPAGVGPTELTGDPGYMTPAAFPTRQVPGDINKALSILATNPRTAEAALGLQFERAFKEAEGTEPPKTRQRIEGARIVTEDWNKKEGKWVQQSSAPRWKGEKAETTLLSIPDPTADDPNRRKFVRVPHGQENRYPGAMLATQQPTAAKAPSVAEFFDESGNPYKAMWHPSRGWVRVGGSKAASTPTPAQAAHNTEIEEARKRILGLRKGLEPGQTLEQAIIGRTQKATETGSANPAYDPNLDNDLRLARKRKIGADPEFQNFFGQLGTVGGGPIEEGGGTTHPPAPTNPLQRQKDAIYMTPRGPMRWTGTGWLPAPYR